jgi:hypothetical protein
MLGLDVGQRLSDRRVACRYNPSRNNSFLYLGGPNRRWRYYDLTKSSRHVIDDPGYKPRTLQSGNRPEQSNIDGNRRSRIGDAFALKSPSCI